MEGMEGWAEGCLEGYAEGCAEECTEVVQRGTGEVCGGVLIGHRGDCHWLPLATIDLVGDNREFEV